MEAYLWGRGSLFRSILALISHSNKPPVRGEHQTVLPPQGASPIYLLQLALKVASEGIQRALSELHAPSAALSLGGCEHRAALCGGQGSAHPEGPRLEIHV